MICGAGFSRFSREDKTGAGFTRFTRFRAGFARFARFARLTRMTFDVALNRLWPATTVSMHQSPNPVNPVNPAPIFIFDIFVEFWYNNVQYLTGGRRNEIWLLMFPPRFAAL